MIPIRSLQRPSNAMKKFGIIYGSAQAPDQSGRGTVTTSTGSRIVRNASSGVISGRMMMSSILDQTARESWALPYIIPKKLACASRRNSKRELSAIMPSSIPASTMERTGRRGEDRIDDVR